MSLQTVQHWNMDSHSHFFPEIPGGLTADVQKILGWVKDYDEICQDARATMIKKINELIGNDKPLK